MIRPLLLLFILYLSITNLQAQSPFACTQTADCFEYKLLGATRFDDERVKLMYTLKVTCNNLLDYVAFELPEGSRAATPANVVQQNNDYTVRNGRSSNNGKNQIDTDFNAVQFNAKNQAAINSGKEELFELYLTNADYDRLAATGMRVQARTSNGTVGQVTFDLNTCAAVPAPDQDPATACELDLGDAIFGFVDAISFPDGSTTIRFLIRNNTTADVDQVQIETPSTPQTISVAAGNKGSAYKAKYNYTTTLDQDNDQITFRAQNTSGYANGGTDLFAIVVPTAVYQADPFFRITLTAGSSVISTGFNTQTCEDAPITPLAVELTSFEGIATKHGITLTWSTASETSNAGFEVERSLDGTSFTKVGDVTGAGTSLTRLTYTYTDAGAKKGTNYYRLRQLDHDGTFEYSHLIAVTKDRDTPTDNLSVYPNPAVGSNITIRVAGSAEGNKAALQIIDANGNVVFSKQLTTDTFQADLPLSELKLSSGIYLVRLNRGMQTETKKLVIP